MNALLPVIMSTGLLLASPVLIKRPLSRLMISPMTGSVSAFSISPTSVSLPSSTPNNIVSTTATAGWTVNLAALLGSTWTLSVSAIAPSCSTAPLNSISVRCTAITDSGIVSGVHVCAASVSLSTTTQTLASGTDAGLTVSGHRSVSIQISFSDTFKYTATTVPCNVNFSYQIVSM